MEFNVKTQKQFNTLRTLVLLSEIIEKEDIQTFFEGVFHDYFPVNPVLAPFEDGVWDTLGHQMKGHFSFYEQDMWDLWYMYTYNYVMNYAYNIDDEEIEDIDTKPVYTKSLAAIQRAKSARNEAFARTLDNMTDKALKKFVRAVNNQAVEQTRISMAVLQEQVLKKPPQVVRDGKKLTMHLVFIWKSREDAKVCTKCDELEGQTLMEIPQVMPHPNCRCDFVIYEWWTDEDKNVVADRSYEVEQNKQAKGKGFSVKQNKVTSKIKTSKDGKDYKQITIFEILEDGKTTKRTYTEGEE